MKKRYLFSKLHMGVVTDSQVAYDGSITVDKQLMAEAGIDEYEKVLVVDVTNGNRFETYIIKGEQGDIILNGGTALLGKKGDKVIIFSFCDLDVGEARSHRPRKVFLDKSNSIERIQEG